MLCDPFDDVPLAINANIALSRFPSSADASPVILPARTDLRALVVVANPTDLEAYGPTPLSDVPARIDRIVEILSPIPVTVLGDHPSSIAPRNP